MIIKENQFIDIHTHHKSADSNVLSIRNLLISELQNNSNQVNEYYSTGIHPWYISSNRIEMEMKLLQNAIGKPEFIAVGEAGLDKACRTPFLIQFNVFSKQVAISSLMNKPMIIHCVRAFSEVIAIHKNTKCKIPWIFHDFRGNLQIATELIKSGCYLSFGTIITKSEKLQRLFIEIPLDRIFFETDNEVTNISNIYTFAAEK
jgi:TatD DNase family protein